MRVIRRNILLLFASGIFVFGLIQMWMKMLGMMRNRQQQMNRYRHLLIASQRYTGPRRNRQERSVWVEGDRTSAWWQKFMDDIVPPSRWKADLRMSKECFYELCDFCRPFITKKDTRFRDAITAEAQVGIFLYYIADEV